MRKRGGSTLSAPLDVVAEYKKSGKISALAVLKHLAVLKRSHEHFGERNVDGKLADVTIPFDLIDVIGAALAGRTNWQRAQARQKAGMANEHYSAWQTRATEIKSESPRKKKKEVANQIAAELAAKGENVKPSWIERNIRI
jgi:hypothetical protein